MPRFLVRPVEQFMRQEAAGGIVLAAATIAALVWANLDAGSYASLWDTSVTLEVGGRVVREDLDVVRQEPRQPGGRRLAIEGGVGSLVIVETQP